MISATITHRIREQLANRIEIESKDRDSCIINMPFVFDDGDPCGFMLTKGSDDTWYLSDKGVTARRASYIGADLLAPGHVERFRSIVGFYGMTEENGALLLPVRHDDFSDAIFTFTQACLEMVNLAKMPKERSETVKTDFSKRLAKLVESAIPENHRVAHWHHPTLDPEHVYPVDYWIKGKSRDLYLFGVSNPMHAARATIACYHYKRSKADFKSVAIYDHEEKLSPRDTVPLNEIVDKRFPRVNERRSIQEYLTTEAA